jgi:hypothetical protein
MTRSRLLYHFTHVDNLSAILASGALVSDRLARERTSTDVGDHGVKAARRTCDVPVGPGGCVDEYVPFYFAPRSPMMYRIACDHRDSVDGRYPDGDHPLVYLVTSIDRVVSAHLPWVASDGNCASGVTTYTDCLVDLDAHVDWPLMTERYWNNTPDDPDRMRRRMAEFLIKDRLPINWLLGFATGSDNLAGTVRELLRD